MGFKEAAGFCKVCNRQVMVRAKTPNHVLHFLISAFTCGLWIIPWILMGISSSKYRCIYCGSKHISWNKKSVYNSLLIVIDVHHHGHLQTIIKLKNPSTRTGFSLLLFLSLWIQHLSSGKSWFDCTDKFSISLNLPFLSVNSILGRSDSIVFIFTNNNLLRWKSIVHVSFKTADGSLK